MTEGYKIPFDTYPPLTTTVPNFPESPDPSLHYEVQLLLQKGAIMPSPLPLTPGFFSSIFTVPKKTGGYRLIFNLKVLNAFVSKGHFKMETLRSVREAVCPQEWTISLDLTDAYLHVPIHPDSEHV